MHLWQNLHHTDRHTYQKNKSIFDETYWLMRKLLEMARTNTRHAGKVLGNADDLMRDNHSLQARAARNAFRWSYVFHAIPKSHSVALDPDGTKDSFLRLNEGFGIPKFLFQVAVILYGLVLGVQFRSVSITGLQGLELHLRLVEIFGWISVPLSLIITLWFRSSAHTSLEHFWQKYF